MKIEKNMTLTQKLASAVLRPHIEFLRAKPGRVAEFVKELSKFTGKKQFRQNVDEWLHPDPERRVEPRLGMGLAICAVVKQMRVAADNE